MPNLEEVALPFCSVTDPPPNMTVTVPRVHTVGMEISRVVYASMTPENEYATYVEICCSLFPNMGLIRTTSTTSFYTVNQHLQYEVGPMVHLKKAAAVLKERGIKFQDWLGWDIISRLVR